MSGWSRFHRTSIGLGLRGLAAGYFPREVAIRLLAPLEDSRLYELPETLAALAVKPGERVRDLASPKLAAVELARMGAQVTSVDLLEPKVETWRRLTGHVEGLERGTGKPAAGPPVTASMGLRLADLHARFAVLVEYEDSGEDRMSSVPLRQAWGTARLFWHRWRHTPRDRHAFAAAAGKTADVMRLAPPAISRHGGTAR